MAHNCSCTCTYAFVSVFVFLFMSSAAVAFVIYVLLSSYLNDWQERGHLEAHELNTLFGNIQEVYDFNVILLSELEQSGTEPIKIAKCFIKLQDEFDAYTQYW